MKKFIYNTNQYLLERYPNVWNTKVVWVLGAALILHLIFFLIGFISLTNKYLLQERRAIDNFFENGTVFLGIMVSIILLVVWLINMFKNNSFKNFYPTKKLDIFKQFALYFIIIFSTTTFYYSYIIGLKSYININYPDQELYSDISSANNAALFLSHNVSDYTVNNIAFPKPFDTLYCETEKSAINYNQSHLSFLEYKYQFFTLRKEKQKQGVIEGIQSESVVFRKTIQDSVMFFYKDSLVDVATKYGKNAVPTYFNHSETFYTSTRDEALKNNYNSNRLLITKDYEYGYNNTINTPKEIKRNKTNYELLKRNNSEEIKTLINNFHNVLNKHKIDNNISKDQWFNIINTNSNFNIKHLIREEPKVPYNSNYSDPNATVEETALQKYYKQHITDFYIESDKLKHVFENLETIKDKNIFEGSIHVFLWIAFCLSVIIFTFRITGLKSLLFTIITAIVLIIILTLFGALIGYLGGFTNTTEEYFISYFALTIGTLILVLSIFYGDKIKKSISAVLLNLSITIFVPYLLLIIGIITMHQKYECRARYNTKYNYQDCVTLIDTLGIYWSYVLLLAGFIFIYLFASKILKWKSLPEG